MYKTQVHFPLLYSHHPMGQQSDTTDQRRTKIFTCFLRHWGCYHRCSSILLLFCDLLNEKPVTLLAELEIEPGTSRSVTHFKRYRNTNTANKPIDKLKKKLKVHFLLILKLLRNLVINIVEKLTTPLNVFSLIDILKVTIADTDLIRQRRTATRDIDYNKY